MARRGYPPEFRSIYVVDHKTETSTGKGQKPGELERLRMVFADTPLDSATSLSLRLDRNTVENERAWVFQIPIGQIRSIIAEELDPSAELRRFNEEAWDCGERIRRLRYPGLNCLDP